MIPEKPSALEYAGKLLARLRSELGIEDPKLKGIAELAFLDFDIDIHEAEIEDVARMRAAFFEMRNQLNVFAQWSVGGKFSLTEAELACAAAKLLIVSLPSSYAEKAVIDKAELEDLRAIAKLYRAETQRVAEAETLGKTANCEHCHGTGLITEETPLHGRVTKRCGQCEALGLNWHASNRIEPTQPWPRQ